MSPVGAFYQITILRDVKMFTSCIKWRFARRMAYGANDYEYNEHEVKIIIADLKVLSQHLHRNARQAGNQFPRRD
jgi:hypothetical protein